MTTTWLSATMIQAHWRSYHVRRMKLDKASTNIQRHMRGCLLRKTLRRHSAAVTIQRHALGMITRKMLRGRVRTVVKMQKLVRGHLGRNKARAKRGLVTKTAITIQCGVRCMIARRRFRERLAAKRLREAQLRSATNIQRAFRGCLGRTRFNARRDQHNKEVQQYRAASKLQAMARRDAAIKRVDILRADRLDKMSHAATFMRKMWLGTKTRRKFKELLQEFASQERHVIVIQRHARGFLIRLKMWREAIRMEEELWGALEIQRCWRGYLGRVRWEDKYEEVWKAEMKAALVQRLVKGWIARTRVGRMRRRIARAEFEQARLRFRCASRIQAVARGMLTRKVTHAMHARKVTAAIHVQRHWRGHVLRKRLWEQVVQLRATMIQAAARGFLVRNRRVHLLAKVICIQRAWRTARRRPAGVKVKAREEMKRRKANAAVIQKKYRERLQEKEVEKIQAGQVH